jgi:hypothetical protein
MTGVQRAAQIFGIVFTLVAIIGFLASGASMEADHTTAPRALGLFPVNLVHNLAHLAFGIWGLMAARRFDTARSYCIISGAAYALLTVLGFIAPDTFGLMPIGGNDIWLHALLALALLGVGLTAKPQVADTARV